MTWDSIKIFAFIPVRYESTRFEGKPLDQIAGKPMIQHVYERAVSCPELDQVYVATDNERISACVHEFGGRAIMTEKSHRCGTDRISEAAEKMGLEKGDIVINIQGDQPKFHQSHMGQLIEPLVADRSIPMTTLKWRFGDESEIQSPKDVMVVTDRQGFAIYFSRFPIPFFRNGKSEKVYYKHLGLYGFRMDFLTQFARLPEGVLESAEKLEQLRALEHGFKIKVMETPFDSYEVDFPEDAKKVEKMLL
jgi:3-deoxy-manno-octulosonate cytidylyltransferase (CMP-KDO synthetase)